MFKYSMGFNILKNHKLCISVNVLHKRDQRKLMRKEVFYPEEIGHNIVRILGILKKLQNEFRSFLDEVRALPE